MERDDLAVAELRQPCSGNAENPARKHGKYPEVSPTCSGAALALFALFSLAAVDVAYADVEIALSYKDKKFDPAEISAPANTPIVIKLKNLDAKAMEFESTSLRVEKVVAANSEGIINVRALKPGRYEFYDDFNAAARGALIVQ